MKKYVLYVLPVLMLANLSQSNAQSKNPDTLFKYEQYAKALPLYKKIVQKDSTKKDAVLKIGRIYNYAKEFAIAENWYAKAGEQKLLEDPIRMLEYAELLRISGKYTQAAAAYRSYYQKTPGDLKALTLATHAETTAQLRKAALINNKSWVNLLDKPNTSYAEFSPWLLKDQLLFLTDRFKTDSLSKGKVVKNTIYHRTGKGFSFASAETISNSQTKLIDSVFKRTPQKISSADSSFLSILKQELNVGPLCFNKTGDTVFFSRVHDLTKEKSKSKAKIQWQYSYNELCFMVKKGTAWSEIKVFPYNDYHKYSTMHPALSADGKRLYFSSDRPGSLGGFDIFYSERLKDNTWSFPVNAGCTVNTEGNELFSSIDDYNTLFFSSDGHLGLGGLDLFSTSLKVGNCAITKPFHLPEPINSSADDFGVFVIQPSEKDQKYGYLSSNRIGGKGLDDLYSFYLNLVTSCPVDILVLDRATKKPLANVKVSLGATVKDSVQTKYTDASGKLAVSLKDCLAEAITFSKALYVPLADSIGLNKGKTSYTFLMDLAKGYAVEGKVTDALTGTPLDSVSIQIKDNKTLVKNPQTTADGKYASALEKNKRYLILAKKKGYFTKRSVVVSTLDKPEGTIFNVDFELEKVVINKEIKIENIYYDFAKATLRKESLPELDKIRDMLLDNPELMVELSAHTDSRGKDAANMLLSQRRAESVVKYLVSKGIPARQLISRGYGETKLINQCANGVNCTEAEHQLNRRTEFKIIGYVKSLPVQKAAPKKVIKPVMIKK
ncbi:OmpA family protein [Pedobacter sp. UC225_61]|uniref:OmpA family protein n=1 Tax=Pedobacter sp. UC225_61 TaxID=3374623 RepID=UPI0037898A40